jgi:putative endonuclease
MTAWVYIVANQRNGTLYIGVTGHLASRIQQHKAMQTPGFTKRYELTLLVMRNVMTRSCGPFSAKNR